MIPERQEAKIEQVFADRYEFKKRRITWQNNMKLHDGMGNMKIYYPKKNHIFPRVTPEDSLIFMEET